MVVKLTCKLSESSIKDRISIEAINYVRPTHFITLSLNQARKIRSDAHGDVWVRGDDTVYGDTHRSFIRSLSKRLASRTSWVQHNTLLRSACTVEGGQNGTRNHLHMIVAKPDHVDEEQFRIMVLRTAAGNAWIMNDDYAVNIQRINTVAEAVRATLYCVKQGVERVTLS